eukprot:tig00000076_g2382.t1
MSSAFCSQLVPSARLAVAGSSAAALCPAPVQLRSGVAPTRAGQPAARTSRRSFHVEASLPSWIGSHVDRMFLAADAATFDPLPAPSAVPAEVVEAVGEASSRSEFTDQVLGAFYIIFFVGCAALTVYSVKVTAEENERKAQRAKAERARKAAEADKDQSKEMNREARRRLEKLEKKRRQ